MDYIKFILILFLLSTAAHADQNDKRLDGLFIILGQSKDYIEMNKTISVIWDIWLETNDVLIENDFKEGLE